MIENALVISGELIKLHVAPLLAPPLYGRRLRARCRPRWAFEVAKLLLPERAGYRLPTTSVHPHDMDAHPSPVDVVADSTRLQLSLRVREPARAARSKRCKPRRI